ncbi:helix-turn-helix domain-containing protein [Paraglaciecola arctica]|uniref:helix-turn-helix domain-containing protein n=1 Tax=Paraglaciecola arctica TaxID=1128911 RepID=UPI001C06DECC|nr:AraC family transcriptional regulator [Paraglaciecola arctica]MBU3002319.1 helix-turn-helix domain-containing protein [Paraglaciecola arctica]
MQSVFPYYILVICCIGIVVKHALQKEKQLINYLFIIFCASLCMVGAQNISAPSLGAYQYLIGLATCATCNVVWLIARVLFRKTNPISRRHVALAMTIAGLIALNQIWHLLIAIDIQHILSTESMLRIKAGMNEITTLLSSSILVLSFWEALRGYSSKNNTQKNQSIIFASAFIIALLNSSVLPKFLFIQAEIDQYYPWIMTSSALLVVAAIQYVIYLQTKVQQATPTSGTGTKKSDDNQIDSSLVNGITRLINHQQIYLKPNLKIADFAQALEEPEYKISKAIRVYFKSANFNLFVNQYRVQHAQQLLLSEHAKHWTILVIALESGFSSLATFNRVFKAISGDMPNEYRKQAGVNNLELSSVTKPHNAQLAQLDTINLN